MKENELQSVVKLATGIYEYCSKPQVKDPSMVQQFYEYVRLESITEQVKDGRLLVWGAIEGQTLCAVGAMQSDAHITMIYVHPYYQKRGIGAALLKEMADYAAGILQAHRVTLHAIPAAAAGYFIRNGFMQMTEISSNDDFCPLEYRFVSYNQQMVRNGNEVKSIKTGTLIFILFMIFLLVTLGTVVSVIYSILAFI